jgi:hypothetical protein
LWFYLYFFTLSFLLLLMLTVLNNLIVQISQKIDNLNAFEYSVVDFSLITTWFNEISLYSCKRTPTLQKSNITILKIYFVVITYISSKANQWPTVIRGKEISTGFTRSGTVITGSIAIFSRQERIAKFLGPGCGTNRRQRNSNSSSGLCFTIHFQQEECYRIEV